MFLVYDFETTYNVPVTAACPGAKVNVPEDSVTFIPASATVLPAAKVAFAQKPTTEVPKPLANVSSPVIAEKVNTCIVKEPTFSLTVVAAVITDILAP
jgi:hypothetical protein